MAARSAGLVGPKAVRRFAFDMMASPITACIVALLIVLAQPVISVLFERGAFTHGDLVRTAGAMQFYAIGLLGLAASILLTRCFFAMRDSRTPVIVASSVMVLNVILSALLVHPFGINGLASANSLASLAEAAVLYWLLRSRIGASDDELAGSSVFRILVASVCMALAGYFVNGILWNLLNLSIALWLLRQPRMREARA